MTSNSSTETPPMILTTLSRDAENSGGEYCEDLPHTSVATFWTISATPIVVSTQDDRPRRGTSAVEWPQRDRWQFPAHERQHDDHQDGHHDHRHAHQAA